MPNPYVFRKAERLCSRKRIEALFAGGSRSLSAYPLRAVFRKADGGQLLISVSKRHFKHAVDRNRVKRLIREAYRLNKHLLTNQFGPGRLDLALIWMSDEMADFSTIEDRVRNLLQRIGEQL
ncbi:MAG: ribonuclease P protein component [Bacteroidaceae bacterium]|nr:ribonuclease P protein component [Bacteroidaceae bacterium]